jgi:hypothetical protein
MKVHLVYPKDFYQIYPILEKFNNPFLKKSDWQGLFKNNFPATEDYQGFWLEHEGTAIGFLGIIFSQRIMTGKLRSFANITSFIVDEKYQGAGTLLLKRIVKLSKSHILTSFSANPLAAELYKTIGFQSISSFSRIFPPSLGGIKKIGQISTLINKAIVPERLSDSDRQIFEDHSHLDCVHVLCEQNGNSCYFIGIKVFSKNLPVIRICYISDIETYYHFANEIHISMCYKCRVMGVMVDSFLLEGYVFPFSFKSKGTGIKLVKSPENISIGYDLLYSEVLALFPAEYQNRKQKLLSALNPFWTV